jgi:SAM-dependent methyltransferase
MCVKPAGVQLTNEIQPFSQKTLSKAPERTIAEQARRLAAVDFVLSMNAQPVLDQLAHEALDDAHTLALLTQLRRTFSADVAAELLAQARLRRRASAKFVHAARMFFVAEALEQATAQAPAEHRAAQLDALAPAGNFLDLGCGIGGDMLALAQRRTVIAYEIDPVRARVAQANAAVLGLADRVRVHVADWTAALATGTLPPAAAAFVDPARRRDGRRAFSLHAMQPSLTEILKLCNRIPLVAVKVMPGVRNDELPADCCVEFVSHEGVCKEAVLWFGRDGAPRRWATVHCADRWCVLADDGVMPPLGELMAGMFLYEPDPAIIRAGALAPLCARLNGHLFAPDIAYIVASTFNPEALAQAFLIEEVHRFSLKLLNQRLAALEVGQVELLKRGFPQEPESLRPRLRLTPGGRSAAVIFTRRGDERLMLIGRRMNAAIS